MPVGASLPGMDPTSERCRPLNGAGGGGAEKGASGLKFPCSGGATGHLLLPLGTGHGQGRRPPKL